MIPNVVCGMIIALTESPFGPSLSWSQITGRFHAVSGLTGEDQFALFQCLKSDASGFCYPAITSWSEVVPAIQNWVNANHQSTSTTPNSSSSPVTLMSFKEWIESARSQTHSQSQQHGSLGGRATAGVLWIATRERSPARVFAGEHRQAQ